MNQNVKKEIDIKCEHIRRRRKWKKYVLVLACAVLLTTVSSLVRPASTMEREPICGIPAHTHGPECYREEKVLICTEEECEPHTHTGECYDENNSLICGKEETQGHVHGEECYRTETVLTCEKTEHQHTDDCYEQPDPYADKETAADWEASFANVELTGYWEHDLPALAESQLGYEESSRNFKWSEGGFKMGYSRYGEWYGEPYKDWNAMFLSFCLHYAGIPAEVIPPQSGCLLWVQELEKRNLLTTKGQPSPGDILFIDSDADGLADRAAVVKTAGGENGETVLCAIEGDCDGAVKQTQYTAGSAEIVSFCPVAQVQKRLSVLPEEKEYTLTYEDEKMTAAVTLRGLPQLLAADASLTVQELTKENAPDAYRTAVKNGESTLKDGQELGAFNLFSFEILSNGEKVAVPDTAEVTVKVSFKKPLFTPEEVRQSADLQTLVLDELNPETLPSAQKKMARGRSAAQPQKAADSSMQTDSTYEGVEKGVTELTYHAAGLSPFAVMLTNQTQNGKFWKLNRSDLEFASGQPYLVVSAEGNYALTNNGSTFTRVELQPVKGNPDYYTIEHLPKEAIWTYNYNFLAGGTRSLSQSTGGWFGKKTFVNPAFTQKLFGDKDINLGFEKSNCPACFNLHNGQYYLNYNGDAGRFLGSTSQRLFSGQSNFQWAKTSDMLILQQVDATLTIPEDATTPNDGSGQPGSAGKPSYPAYKKPSGEKVGSYENEAGKVDYASDPSTSQIENLFGNHPLNGKTDFEAQKVDDGKALLDKSVIYGGDDYNAFSQYEDGTFSVTMSALGQAFVVNEFTTKVPMDVLLILDMSNSMNESDPGQSESRAQILVNSVNKTMNHIMKAHPENRVCAVGYNSGAYDLLALGHHWKGEGGQYFKYTPKGKNQWGEPSGSISATGLSGLFGPEVPCENGTYTQMGIAKGYDLLMRNTPNPADTTYTTTVNGQSVTRPRKPVIILISDGEPTHCTSHYMDVLHNPYYGDGLGPVSNGKGAQGYYTILSANYYKRMIGIHYNNPATMYTVAFGMKENDFTVMEGSAATNHYRATVMNPTAANINALQNAGTKFSNQVEKPLYQMLQGSYSGEPMKVGGYFNFIKQLGNPHSYVPVLKNNPYRGNYAYANKAYLNNSGNQGLDAAFEDIVKLNTVYDFSYETQADKPLTLTDPIGEGMEIRGDPVLRINGKNYKPSGKQEQGNTTLYTFSGKVPMDPYTGRIADLSAVKVKVENAGGKQNVTMEIPPKYLPTYTADSTRSFYHESLPVRLIYQVGLSAEGKAKIDSLQPGEKATFYTNRYLGESAKGSLAPSDNNHYYQKAGWQINQKKTSNPTGTAAASLVKNGSNTAVQYQLGNNGKLTITKKAPPVKPVEPVSVRKDWRDYNGDPMNTNLPEKITAKLYRTYLDESSGEVVKEDVLQFELTAANGWKHTFTPEELHAVPGREYKYYVEESKLEDFKISYTGDGILTNTPETPIIITNRYRYSDVVLPQTGGHGTLLFTAGGLLLITAAFLIYRYVLKSKRKEGRGNRSS